MRYKCLIAEDNPIERDLLEILLGNIEQVEVVAVFPEGLSALQYLLEHSVDLVFSDVDMPQLSGIHLLESLRHPPVFVFISAFSEYAAKGFDLDVADFIVKPVTPQRLLRAFTKGRELLEKRTAAAPPAAPGGSFIFAPTIQGLQKLLLKDIVYAESKGNFCAIRLTSGSSHLVLVSLKALEEQLAGGQFVRIHRYFLANWQLITLVQKDSLTMVTNQELPIGDAYRKEVLALLATEPVLKRRPGG